MDLKGNLSLIILSGQQLHLTQRARVGRQYARVLKIHILHARPASALKMDVPHDP